MEILESTGVPIHHWTKNVSFEEAAKQQILNVASLPFIYKHIAVMPDVHYGIGCTIGSVVPTINAIIPACVGVDIGCGMKAVKTNLSASDLPDNLHSLRLKIEENIPVGSNPKLRIGMWKDIPKYVEDAWSPLVDRFNKLCDKYPRFIQTNNIHHLGTLGGGNHFIEICLDTNQHVWFMLHSGSRGIGNAIGTHFIELAKKDMERYFINLPDKDLAYLPKGSDHFDDYIESVTWAQEFARKNRDIMMNILIETVSSELNKEVLIKDIVVDCHHNYISQENHFGKNVFITRKGAVSARKDEMGIIPGSMGERSYIVKGLGNIHSFHSCSHGAGRKMSRIMAKKVVSLKEHQQSLSSVECRKNETTLDETPNAYKNIDDVMNAQSDLIEIVETLKQILCVKG